MPFYGNCNRSNRWLRNRIRRSRVGFPLPAPSDETAAGPRRRTLTSQAHTRWDHMLAALAANASGQAPSEAAVMRTPMSHIFDGLVGRLNEAPEGVLNDCARGARPLDRLHNKDDRDQPRNPN